MQVIREESPNTLSEFVQVVEQIQIRAEEPLWFRGCGKKKYKLLPSLYRHKQYKKPDQFSTLEQQLMGRFRQRSIPYHNRDLRDDWSALFFMQHYGIPTRLLDWTENPLIALHFALMGAPHQMLIKTGIKFKEDACVWVLDPVKWNQHALFQQSYRGGALSNGDEALNGYKPSHSFIDMNNFPVALYGEHNSPRIVAQQGVFTIFGQVVKPMEDIFVEQNFPEDSLIKIVLKTDVIKIIRKSLLRHGITESVVYPDLDGLALEIKRAFNFTG